MHLEISGYAISGGRGSQLQWGRVYNRREGGGRAVTVDSGSLSKAQKLNPTWFTV